MSIPSKVILQIQYNAYQNPIAVFIETGINHSTIHVNCRRPQITKSIFIYHFFINVRIHFSPFSHNHFPPPHHHHIPRSILPPMALSMGPLYMFFDDPFSSFLHYVPSPSLLVTVSLLLISMSLVIFACLFVLLIRFHLKVRSSFE